MASEEQCRDGVEIPKGEPTEAADASVVKEALSKLEGRIRGINPHAPIIHAQFSQVLLLLLLLLLLVLVWLLLLLLLLVVVVVVVVILS